MTTVQINLPDQLAAEAQNAGLLSSEVVEQWLRETLRTRQIDNLFAAMNRLNAAEPENALSPEEVAEEIRIMRQERRERAKG